MVDNVTAKGASSGNSWPSPSRLIRRLSNNVAGPEGVLRASTNVEHDETQAPSATIDPLSQVGVNDGLGTSAC